MKHIVNVEYKDIELKRVLTKGAVLEEEYKKDNVELTKERISYLVDERKLCIAVEEIPEGKVGDITAVDEVPEGEKVVDRVDIVEETKEPELKAEVEQEQKESENIEEKKEEKENNNEASVEDKEQKETKEPEPKKEIEQEKNKTKNAAKTETKTSKKDEEK